MAQEKPETTTFWISGILIAGWVLGHVLHGIGSILDYLVYDPLFRPRDFEKPSSGERSTHALGTSGPAWIRRFRTPLHSLYEWLKKGLHSFREQGYFHKNDVLHRRAMGLAKVPDGVPGGMYQWARAWLVTHRPESMPSLERTEADSKLFRSLAVLLFMVSVLPFTVHWYLVRSLAFSRPSIHCFASPGDHSHFESTNLETVSFVAVVFPLFLFSLWRYCDLRNKAIRQCYLNYVQLRLGEEDKAKADHDKIPSSEKHA
jgi:hypothetical protein